MEKFYMLKVKEDNEYLANMFRQKKGKLKFKKTIDQELYDHIDSDTFDLIVIFFNEDFKLTELLVTKAEKTENNYEYEFTEVGRTISPLKIDNFKHSLIIDLNNDFKREQYLTEEYAYEIFVDLKKSLLNYIKKNELIKNNKNKFEKKTYKQLDEEATVWDRNAESGQLKNQFETDRERITNSKAFRRLVDKAQIFTASKGDHYRTRMTHTLEVAQISRNLARQLHLNEDLAEAIALGHDIGHTPFGHQGERTLDDILSGKIGIIKNIDKVGELKQRFKHNFQSLRVLTYLENISSQYEGLNISYETMEGIWKHTKLVDRNNNSYGIDDFFKYDGADLLYPDVEHSVTLEGQVVAIADEIAQRSHDIDDAFKSHKLTHETFIKYSNLRKIPEIRDIDIKINNQLDQADNEGMIFVDKNDMYRVQLSSEIVNYFVNDVVNETKKRLEETYPNIPDNNLYYKKCVDFSEHGNEVNELLSRIITQKVINSSEVARFDKSTSQVVIKLFEYYYENPLCLEDNTLMRIYKEMKKFTDNCIDFRNSYIETVKEEIEDIVHLDLSDTNKDIGDDVKKQYIKKRKILARCIADHISGMTDTYALKECQLLYKI